MRVRALLPVLAVSAAAAGCSPAAVRGAPDQLPLPAPAAASGEPAAERLDGDRLRIGKVIINQRTGTATLPAVINMREGPIEYLAVTPEGKRHESLLMIDDRPLHLQVALIMLGLEPGEAVAKVGSSSAPVGPGLTLELQWKSEGKTIRKPAALLVRNAIKEQPLRQSDWIFSGSALTGGELAADLEGSFIATYRTPSAIINNALPEGDDDTAYEVNRSLCPPEGTAVELLVSQRAVSAG